MRWGEEDSLVNADAVEDEEQEKDDDGDQRTRNGLRRGRGGYSAVAGKGSKESL
jgi:hypothetical protein